MILSIDETRCIGCGSCAEHCPLDTLRMNDRGKAYIAYPEDCHTCYLCEMNCPADAIYVHPFKKPFPSAFAASDPSDPAAAGETAPADGTAASGTAPADGTAVDAAHDNAGIGASGQNAAGESQQPSANARSEHPDTGGTQQASANANTADILHPGTSENGTPLSVEPEIIRTNLLIIGGGSSGLWAARAAKEKDPDCDVLIVDKSFADWGGLMSLSGGDLEVCMPPDTPGDWVKDFVYYWDGLCEQDVLEKIWSESSDVFEEYLRLGCSYLKNPDGSFRSVPQRSLSHVKLFPVQTKGTGGSSMRKALVSEMKRLNVRRMGRIEITELIKQDDRIAGAVGFNYVTGQPLIFCADAVILAGGIASWKPSYNQNTASGEGPCLAFGAGAVLQNFEFLHIWNVPRAFEWEGQTVLMPLGARFVNNRNEEFMKNYSPVLGTNTDPHYITRAMTLETLAGRGPIHLDMSAIQEKDYPIIKPATGRHLLHYNKLLEEGIDFFHDPFEWSTVVQLSNGAVKTGPDGESGVDGLYIAGRLRSLDPGVYMGGFALMTTAITGRQAGRAAISYIRSCPAAGLRQGTIQDARKSLARTFSFIGSDGVEPSEILDDLQRIIAPYDVSILKTASALQNAQQKLAQLREEKIRNMKARDYHYLLKAQEVKSIADITDFYLTAALFREDSRAGHFRADFPQHDENWLCWVTLTNVNGVPVPSRRPVPIEDYPYPVERYYSDNFSFPS